jgi:Domain of unknown function (DUF4333)
MTVRAVVVVPAALLAAAGLAACGKTTIDTSSAENSISENIQKQLGQKPKSVKCPSEIEAKKGGTFTCTVTAADGSKATIKATQTDDNGHFNFSIS